MDAELATMLTSVRATLEQRLNLARQAQAAVAKQAAAGPARNGAGGVGRAATSSGGWGP